MSPRRRPRARWLALTLNSIPETLSLAELVGAGKIVDDLDDDASDNLLKDAIGDTSLGVASESASWRPYGSARGRRKATGGDIEDFTLENVISMQNSTLATLVAAVRPIKCLICGLAVTSQATPKSTGVDPVLANGDEGTFYLIEGDVNPLAVNFSNTDVMKATLTVAVRDYKLFHIP